MMQTHPLTTACVITPAGRGAIGVIQVQGPNAIHAISECFHTSSRPFVESPIDTIRFGRWESATGEELVVVRTADECAEIHCHGGAAASEAILRSLAARQVEPITSHDLISLPDPSPLAIDAYQALMTAPTEQVAACLLDQTQGALDKSIEEIWQNVESKEIASAISKIDALLAWKPLGRALTEPWRVVLAGPPNVGKSSLVNALVGYDRAIVYDQPGTTRDVVTTTTAIEGWPIQLSDTAGLRETDEPIEAAGVMLARQRLLSADLVLAVVEASHVGSPESAQFLKSVRNLLPKETHMLCIASKVDLAKSLPDGKMLATSTVSGHGIDALLSKISQTLVPELPAQGQAIPFRSWHFDSLDNTKRKLLARDFQKAKLDLQSLLAASS